MQSTGVHIMQQFLPTLRSYTLSLIVTGVVALLAFALLPGNALSPLGLIGSLILGLFIGQTIGSLRLDDYTSTDTQAEQGTQTLYVGNVAFSASKQSLEGLFRQYGEVHSLRLMTDRETRRSRGYGFVEMDKPAANAAIAALDGYNFSGRNLRVSEANERAS